MADEVTAGELRTRRFDVVRKGYDRNQVETFLAQLARQLDALESDTAGSTGSDVVLGIDNSEARGRELAMVGGDVDEILEAARAAAEGLRLRASADAEAWTSEAKRFVDESTSEAEIQANTARGAAWDAGTAMLAAAMDEAERLLAAAETEALRIRAEAEREAIRYTTDAKRASEETIGAAENESEGILQSSRAEGERVLRQANQAAELAQERARALEDRRAELVSELESTRSSIGELETEIETKRHASEEPEPVAVPPYEERTHHKPDGGSVKIVSGSKAITFTPVDADSFVAEVAEMQDVPPTGGTPAPTESFTPSAVRLPPEESRQQEEEKQADEPQDSSLPQLAGGDVEERDRGGAPDDSSRSEESHRPSAFRHPPEEEPRPAESTPLPADGPESVSDSSLPQFAGGDVEERDRGGATDDSSQSLADRQAPEDDGLTADGQQPEEDSIGSLFAQLREGTEQLTVDSSESEERGRLSAVSRQPSAIDSSPSDESGLPSAVISQPASESVDIQPDLDTEEGESTGTASLIPVQNAALRSIKRLLVDLQNDALEHLRTDEAWVPEEEFTDRFSEPFCDLAAAITADRDDAGAASVFATDLYDAVSSAVVTAREAGSGDRSIAAATSKVFRMWRSDEAERRVVAAASDLSDRS